MGLCIYMLPYDVIPDNNMGVGMYSTLWKAMKENQEHTSGDY